MILSTSVGDGSHRLKPRAFEEMTNICSSRYNELCVFTYDYLILV